MGAGADALVAAWYRGAWWLLLLRPLECLFRLLVALRRWLYGSGLLSVYRAPVPVVVVGNITVGGTGKTPVVIALVEALQARGVTVGVVSRGYGARRMAGSYLVDACSRAQDCGDEALLIHRRTGCPCAVSPSRPEAARALLAAAPVQLILSDDGLQHYALARDMEIAVLDAARGAGNGLCLPAGPLREPLSRLQGVDRVLYRGSDDPDNGVRYRAVALVNVASGEQRPVAPDRPGESVHAMAGIGQPDQFFASLAALGFQVQPHPFGDHHDYSAADFRGMADKPIIMTEKDAVKCRTLAGANAWYLQIEAQLPPALAEAVAALAQP
jgi:tetraacyldisaccharide 4'-kinase